MEPISFHPQEHTLKGFGEVRDMPVVHVVYVDGRESMVSCWKMTFMDILRAIFFQKVYLSVSGPHPPVLLSTSLKGIGLHPSQTRNT